MKNGNSYCANWAPYAHDVEGSFGAFVNNLAIVCGVEHPERDECYTISDTSTSFVVEMTEKRSFAAAIAMSETSMWITGGLHGEEALRSSEIIQDGIVM